MFSVLIPAFNHARFVTGAVVSALRSPLVGEVLIVDDGSTDGCRAVVEDLGKNCGPRLRCLNGRAGENLGAPERLNQLARAAHFGWLAVLNSDDQFTPGRFEAARAAIRQTGGDFYFGNILITDQSGRIVGRKRPFFDYEYEPERRLMDLPIGPDLLVALLANQNIIATTSNAIFSRAIFDEVGGFRRFRYVHDWDFFLRASLQGAAHYVPQPFVLYRQHGANTITGGGNRTREEARPLFDRLSIDFPDMARRPAVATALATNRYLNPSHTTSAHRPEDAHHLGEPSRAEYEAELPSSISVGAGGKAAAMRIGDGTYFYEPSGSAPCLSVNQIENALLALSSQTLDFVAVSHSLAPPAEAAVSDLRNSCLFNESARPVIEGSGPPARLLHGRLMRLLPGPNGQPAGAPIPACLPGAIVEADGRVTVGGPHQRVVAKPPYLPPLSLSLPRRSGKKRVLVLPIFMAVGGVERNAIEVMRALADRYDFTVVTFERLTDRQGSLHFQLNGLHIPFYELGEIADQSLHLRLLDRIAEQFDPDLVWICNGSPWLARNAANLRRRFANIPIVDQQVYDTKVGWIEYFNDPGIRSFDRFVAVNAKILGVFNSQFGIGADKTDLIRHGIDTDVFDGASVAGAERAILRREFGLAPNERCYAFIGRLVDQKDPLRYLAMVEEALKSRIDARFLLVGDGDLSADVDRFIAARRLTNLRRIKHCSEPQRLYRAVDGIIMTSKYEGLPLVCIEAMAEGLPILSTDVGDVAWAIAHFGAGEIVVGTPAPSMFAAFRQWHDGLDVLTLKARARAASARRQFGITHCAEQYDACWRRAMEDKAQATAAHPRAARAANRDLS